MEQTKVMWVVLGVGLAGMLVLSGCASGEYSDGRHDEGGPGGLGDDLFDGLGDVGDPPVHDPEVGAVPDATMIPDGEFEDAPDEMPDADEMPDDGGAPPDVPDAPEDFDAGDSGSSEPDVRDEPDVEPDADEPDVGEPDPLEVELLSVDGMFLEVAGQGRDPERVYRFGRRGQQYERIIVDFDVQVAGWRTELFDRPTLNHNIFGLSRDVSSSYHRYLLGAAAQIQPPPPNLEKSAIFYARVDLEPREQGMGYTSYQSFRQRFGWDLGATYHLRTILDVVAARQTLIISRDGQEVGRVVGDIPYMTRDLTTSGFFVDFGGAESDGREVKAVGWRFHDLRIIGEIR